MTHSLMESLVLMGTGASRLHHGLLAVMTTMSVTVVVAVFFLYCIVAHDITSFYVDNTAIG